MLNEIQDIINTRLDRPGNHVSLVKKVRDKIKQEASTKISSSAGQLAAEIIAVGIALVAAYVF